MRYLFVHVETSSDPKQHLFWINDLDEVLKALGEEIATVPLPSQIEKAFQALTLQSPFALACWSREDMGKILLHISASEEDFTKMIQMRDHEFKGSVVIENKEQQDVLKKSSILHFATAFSVPNTPSFFCYEDMSAHAMILEDMQILYEHRALADHILQKSEPITKKHKI